MSEAGHPLSFRRSSHFRIALWYTLLIAAVSVAFGAFIYASQVRDISGEESFLVIQEMEAALKASAVGLSPILQPNECYALFDGKGALIASSGIAEAKALSYAAEGEARLASIRGLPPDLRKGKPVAWFYDHTDRDMVYGYLPSRGPMEGDPDRGETRGPEPEAGKRTPAAAILYGSPLDPYGLRGRLLATILVAVAFASALALLSGAWFASRALRPVARIARAAREIGERDLSRRIGLKTRDELGELSEVFDSMLDRLQAAFDRQRVFVADAGHELKTPLAVIKLEAERALSAPRSPEEYRRSLETVRAECGSMAKLVEGLLELARADDGRSRNGDGVVDLSDIVLEALERFAPLAAQRGVSLSAGELPELLVDGNRAALASAVANLVDNAVKYSRPGGSVRVALEPCPLGAAVRVADEGIGIPADKLPFVFDRFFRVDESRSGGDGAPAGSGLGLAIVKAVALSHGGSVEAESAFGSGSRFSLLLPLSGRRPGEAR